MRMEALNLSRKSGGTRFRIDEPSHADLAHIAVSQQDRFFPGDEEIACFCGD
jgi:hypothetical protein